MLQKFSIIVCVLLLLPIVLISKANAQDQDTILIHTNAPLEFPRFAVGPGTYELRFIDGPSSDNLVEVSDANGNGCGFFQVRPISRLKPVDKTQVELQSEAGSPERVKDWFAIGSTVGYVPVYPTGNPASVANSTALSVGN
jgi:hypothetical protein